MLAADYSNMIDGTIAYLVWSKETISYKQKM